MIKLELKEYKDYLTFLPEYEITNRPKFIEYKVIGDSMEIAALYKKMAYTSMYMSEVVVPLRLSSFFTRHL